MTPSGVQGHQGGAGRRARWPTLSRVEPVHVLGRVDGFQDRAGADVVRQGELDEDAVHRGVRVQGGDGREQLWFRGGSGQAQGSGDDAGGGGGTVLVADVDGAGGVVADQDDGKAGLVAEGGDAGGDAIPEEGGDGLAVDDSGRQRNRPWTSPNMMAAWIRLSSIWAAQIRMMRAQGLRSRPPKAGRKRRMGRRARLGDAVEEVADGPDHAVSCVEHAEAGEGCEQGGDDDDPLVEAERLVEQADDDGEHGGT